MGIPKFYRWLCERYPLINQPINNNIFNVDIDNLYLDVNGLIHNATHSGHELRAKPSDNEVASIVIASIDTILNLVRPKKILYIAVDGVPPRAKVNQQRQRRFRAAKELENENKRKEDVEYFDSNCITPGTEFMQNLDKNLKFMISYKIQTDKLWNKINVIYSGYNVPGEGEHKIMEFIREGKRTKQISPSSYNCIYGLDADLIVLSLSLHMPNFVLLREQIDFLNFANSGKADLRDVKSKSWQYTHISILREYLRVEFLEDVGDKYNFERIIDDFTFLITLCGNDFIPELPSLDIKQGSLDKMIDIYKILLPTFNGEYILSNGLPNKEMMKKLFKQLATIEEESMEEILHASEKIINKNRNRNKQKQKNIKFEKQEEKRNYVISKLGDNASMKNIYYLNKFNIEPNETIERKRIIEEYIHGLFWVYNYYYRGCPSWNWYYPYHYAPMFSDLASYIDECKDIDFEIGNPVDPFIQLLCCLPPQSCDLLPESFRWLMTDNKSPIKEYYPETFDIDPNGKVNDWEGIELIPFIDIKEILKAVEKYEPHKHVNTTENERNHLSYNTLLYHYDPTMKPYSLASTLPNVMPSLMNCYVYVKKMQMKLPNPKNKPIISLEYINVERKGLPTIFNIPFYVYRDFVSMNIFGIQSRKESVILKISSTPIKHIDVPNVLGYHCSCGYPFNFPGIITKIIFPTKTYYYEKYFTKEGTLLTDYFENHSYLTKGLNAREVDSYRSTINVLQENWLRGFKNQLGTGGIEIENISALCEVCPIIGVIDINGIRQWKYSKEPLLFPYELLFFNENIKFTTLKSYSITDKFYINESVIICEKINTAMNDLYGKIGKVLSIDEKNNKIKVEVKTNSYNEKNFAKKIIKSCNESYSNPKTVCKELKISLGILWKLISSIVFDRDYDVGLNMIIHKNNEWFIKNNCIKLLNHYTIETWNNPQESILLIGGQLLQSNRSEEILNNYLLTQKAINTLKSYINRNRTLVQVLEENDRIYFDSYKTFGKDGKNIIEQIINFKSTLEISKEKNIPSTSQIMSNKQIEILKHSIFAIKKINNHLKSENIVIDVDYIDLIGNDDIFEDQHNKNLKPELGNRVLSLGRNNIPFGLKGTIVGIHPSTGFIEVIFDDKFLTGDSLNGLCDVGYGKLINYEDVLYLND